MGSVACEACGLGKHLNATGGADEASCRPCPISSFGPAVGLALCELCPKGTCSGTLNAISNATCLACKTGNKGNGHLSKVAMVVIGCSAFGLVFAFCLGVRGRRRPGPGLSPGLRLSLLSKSSDLPSGDVVLLNTHYHSSE